MEFATKIFGWLILLTGILLIAWTLYTTYNIFTAQAPLPEFFEIAEKDYNPPTTLTPPPVAGVEGIQAQMEKMIGEQLKGIIPADTIPKLLNLVVWSMLAGLLIFGGSQIAGLGIKLIKK